MLRSSLSVWALLCFQTCSKKNSMNTSKKELELRSQQWSSHFCIGTGKSSVNEISEGLLL